jgi:hypothetical protein
MNGLITSLFYMARTQALAKAAFSFGTTTSGTQTDVLVGVGVGGGLQQPHAIHAGDGPTEIYINVLLVGMLAIQIVFSYAPIMNRHSCRGVCFIEQNHQYLHHTTGNLRRPGIAPLRRDRQVLHYRSLFSFSDNVLSRKILLLLIRCLNKDTTLSLNKIPNNFASKLPTSIITQDN